MRFDVSYFCHYGNSAIKNQDRVIVNGDIVSCGVKHLENVAALFCFVADGVGCLQNSENAAQYVLEQIDYLRLIPGLDWYDLIESFLQNANLKLVQMNREAGKFAESATTLCGLIYRDRVFIPMNVGDSEIWLYRNKDLLRITRPHLEYEHIPNSPIINYFGSTLPHMYIDFSTKVSTLLPGDNLVVTTDGLLKAISKKELMQTLEEKAPLRQKINNLFFQLSTQDNPDNLGAIFIQVKKDA
ncbi:MAG: protein phosphatase 2C domain-containing protein [Candidatus Cloacimonas sp.]